MTDSRHTPPAGWSSWATLTPYVAPALVLLTIVVQFLRFHEYSLRLPESLILIAGTAALGIAVGALSLLRPATLGPTLMALTLCVFALYRQETYERVIPAAMAIADMTGRVGLVLGLLVAAIFLAILGTCYLLQRHLHTIVAAVFGTMIVSTIALPTGTGGEPVQAGTLPKDLKNIPPVIHIILDEHIGIAGLPTELAESVVAERAILTTFKDFALYSRAYSHFPETQFSLSSLMNTEPQEDVMALVDAKAIGYTLRRSAWFDRLKAMGYAIKVYQSDWLDMCSEIDAVDACYTYPLYSINAIQRSELSTGARLRVLLGKLYLWQDVALPAPLAASEAFSRFRFDVAETPRGTAYVVHLLLPHYGYLYREDCSLADPSEWMDQPFDPEVSYTQAERLQAYRRYLPQVACTAQKVKAALEDLKRLGIYEEATIIVHGDHGARIGEHAFRAAAERMTERDLVDHFATLLAIKRPGITPGVRAQPVPIQRIFAETFLDGGVGAELPGRVWLRDETTDAFVSRSLSWPGLPDDLSAVEAEVHSARPRLRQSIQ